MIRWLYFILVNVIRIVLLLIIRIGILIYMLKIYYLISLYRKWWIREFKIKKFYKFNLNLLGRVLKYKYFLEKILGFGKFKLVSGL